MNPASERARPPTLLADDSTPQRIPERKPGAIDRDELLQLWSYLSDEGRSFVLAAARAAAWNEGVITVVKPPPKVQGVGR